MKKRTSIHDVAKELNLSSATISFVLNGKANEKTISEDVQRKASVYVKKVSYQPNMIAKSLGTGKTSVIGMLVEDISDPFFSSISRGIETIAYNHKYKIFYSRTSTIIIDNFSGAYQAVRHLEENGFSNIAYITLDSGQTLGFDDNTHFYLFTPSIAAVAKPIEQISEEVVKQSLDALSDEKESRKRRTVTPPVKLVERNSSRQRTKAKPTLEKL